MMTYPYNGEERECAAAARRNMFASYSSYAGNSYSQSSRTSNQNGSGAEDDLAVYSVTSDSEAGIASHMEESAPHSQSSVSTSMLVGTFYNPHGSSNYNSDTSVSTTNLVGTFYNPNNPENSDANSFVSSLQDELSNSGIPREHRSTAAVHSGVPVATIGRATTVIEWKELFRMNRNATNNQSQSTMDIPPWKGRTVPPEGSLGGGRRRRFWRFALGVCILVGIAVAMGVVIGVYHEQNTQSSVRGVPEKESNSDTDAEHYGTTVAQAESSNSIAPWSPNASDVPSLPLSASQHTYTAFDNNSSATPSTTQWINFFVSNLPSYTQEALEIPTSPQKRALHWITADPALTSYSQDRLFQRFALKTFFYATNGGNDNLLEGEQWTQFSGWRSSQEQYSYLHECQWYTTADVANKSEPPCDDQGIYLVLSLRRNNLQGTLPRELSLLTNLRVLDLELNSIQSSLPSELGLMRSLEKLLLPANGFIGGLPTEIGQLPQLVELELYNNAFTGTVPTQLSFLANIVNLTLDDNSLQGTIPSQLCMLTMLETLLLHGNLLTGTIPTEIGRWKQLQSLSLRQNELTGPIPSELGLLTNLERLWAYQNQITQTLPSELGAATRLTMLSLSRNRLTGEIPTQLGLLGSLLNLWLYDNLLTGQIPSELGRLKGLELFLIRGNDITGAVPEEVCAIPAVEVTIGCLEVTCACNCTCASDDEQHDDI